MTATRLARISSPAGRALAVVVGAAAVVVASPGIGRAAPAPGSCPTAFTLSPITVGHPELDRNADGLICRINIGQPGPLDNVVDNKVQGY